MKNVVYLVTQRFDDSFLERIEQACQNGISFVQLREKKVTTNAFYQLAKQVKAITDRYAVPLIINDRVDICLAVDAAGVHIGDDELPVSVVKQLIGDKLLGVSAKTVARALQAQKEGATYLGVGAIFPTKTKENAPTTPVDTLKAIVDAVSIPVVAIGGLTEENLSVLKGTGVVGISAISEIMLADNTGEKVKRLKQKVGEL